MHPIFKRSLAAYRPLYLHGLLRDGPYPWPATDRSARSAAAPRQRLLLAALTGLRHVIRQHRDTP